MSSTVSAAAPQELLPALRLLFPAKPNLANAGFDPSGVFVTRDANGIRGAILAQSMAGAVGLVSPPRAATEVDEDELVRIASDWLRGRGVKVCQGFSDTGETEPMSSLARNGFQPVTQLLALRCALVDERSETSLSFDAEQPPFSEVCRAVLLATHEGSLDCPELSHGRTQEELLAEFTDMGQETAWYLARREEMAVGVAILAPSIAKNEVDLTYLGVAPDSRGQGVGRELLTFARSQALQRGASSMTVSVDRRNHPAVQLYLRNGFTEVGRRTVWLAHIS